MGKIFIAAALLLASDVVPGLAQIKFDGIAKTHKLAAEIDTALRVFYIDLTDSVQQPAKLACFLNGKLISDDFLTALNPSQIEDFDVIKEKIEIEGIEYNGQIYIKTQKGYSPNIMSLGELKEKYVKDNDKPVMFMVDGNIINTDYDRYLIDVNYLLSITVYNIENAKEPINMRLIKLLTRTEENIKRSKQIRIRGTEITQNE